MTYVPERPALYVDLARRRSPRVDATHVQALRCGSRGTLIDHCSVSTPKKRVQDFEGPAVRARADARIRDAARHPRARRACERTRSRESAQRARSAHRRSSRRRHHRVLFAPNRPGGARRGPCRYPASRHARCWTAKSTAEGRRESRRGDVRRRRAIVNGLATDPSVRASSGAGRLLRAFVRGDSTRSRDGSPRYGRRACACSTKISKTSS